MSDTTQFTRHEDGTVTVSGWPDRERFSLALLDEMAEKESDELVHDLFGGLIVVNASNATLVYKIVGTDYVTGYVIADLQSAVPNEA